MSTYRSTRHALAARLAQAIDAGLIAGAEVYRSELKRRLTGGYTSGDFVTGRAINSVTRSAPETVGARRQVRVGTNLRYMLFWELGHHNLFTRKYERVETWRPAMMDSRAKIEAAFTRAFRRIWEGASA